MAAIIALLNVECSSSQRREDGGPWHTKQAVHMAAASDDSRWREEEVEGESNSQVTVSEGLSREKLAFQSGFTHACAEMLSFPWHPILHAHVAKKCGGPAGLPVREG